MHVWVIGGGLAGLTVARELSMQRVAVTLLEADARLGGKAGALEQDGFFDDHGYHVFPGWYVNVRRLLGELGIADRLIDVDRVHYLKPGAFPNVCTLHSLGAPGSFWKNLRSGLVPWWDAILAAYFALDLASAPFSHRRFLDRVSANGFLRSRPYGTERVAETHHHFVLQASSIPNYEISAMTARRITAAWFKTPAPIFSIFDGDLQRRFIDPFARDVAARGVEIRTGTRVARLCCKDGRLGAIELASGERIELAPDDRVVVTTPHEITRRFVDADLYAIERACPADDERKCLSDLHQLRSAPMAALHVHFRRRIAGIPREHTVLVGSCYELSFVDVSQHWPGIGERSVLSCIASEFGSLAALPEECARDALLRDLLGYLGDAASLADVDLQRTRLFSNVEVPLFLNTVGAWHYRPDVRTRVPGLYVAGDWCRGMADLTTMEVAVGSALATAAGLLRDAGRTPRIDASPIPLHPRWMLRAARWLLFPGIMLLWLGLAARAWLRGERPR